jgi:hypothetical protein
MRAPVVVAANVATGPPSSQMDRYFSIEKRQGTEALRNVLANKRKKKKKRQRASSSRRKHRGERFLKNY